MISRHFIWKSIIRRPSSGKTIVLQTSLIRILSFFNKLYTPRVIVQNVPKRNVCVKLPFLGSSLFQIRKKMQKLFTDKLKSCNLKIAFTSLLGSKAFSRISYLTCYFQELFTSISVVAVMLPIMVRPSTF